MNSIYNPALSATIYMDANRNSRSVAAFESAAYSVGTENQNSEQSLIWDQRSDRAGRPLMTGGVLWRC